MVILGPFPDGGYELWCPECNCKITCFAIEELDSIEKIKEYENFICSNCLPILNNKNKQNYE